MYFGPGVLCCVLGQGKQVPVTIQLFLQTSFMQQVPLSELPKVWAQGSKFGADNLNLS